MQDEELRFFALIFICVAVVAIVGILSSAFGFDRDPGCLEWISDNRGFFVCGEVAP